MSTIDCRNWMGKILQYLHSHGIHRAFSSLHWSLQLTLCVAHRNYQGHIFKNITCPFSCFSLATLKKGQSQFYYRCKLLEITVFATVWWTVIVYFKNTSWTIQECTHFMDTTQTKAGIVSHTSRMGPHLQWRALVLLPSNVVGQESRRENSNTAKFPIRIFVLSTFTKGAQFPSHLYAIDNRYLHWTFCDIDLCLIAFYYEREWCILPVIHIVSYLSILLFNHQHSASAICILWIPLSTYSELT